MRITLTPQELSLAVGAFVAEKAGYKIYLRALEYCKDYSTDSVIVSVVFDKLPDPVVTELTLVDP